MPCLLALSGLVAPRVIIVFLVIFTDYIGRAFEGGAFLPVLGFIFLPTTVLAYAWAENTGDPFEGIRLVVIILAVLFDLGFIGGGRSWFIRRRSA